jgi:general transcription factor 3C polypeptide 3 (transcription factor C subunit 4)
MASKLLTKVDLGADADSKTTSRAAGIPADYRGIPFGTWLDIFLEYAICLAKEGKAKEAYEICEAAKDAIVFYHSRDDMFLIHICWGSEFSLSICVANVLIFD